MVLPVSHLEILSAEARFLKLRRGEFLQLLLTRKLGLVLLERPEGAPVYEFSDEELGTTRRFVWYLRMERKVLFDRDRLAMGNVRPRDWVILELNRWIDYRFGVRLKPPASPQTGENIANPRGEAPGATSLLPRSPLVLDRSEP